MGNQIKQHCAPYWSHNLETDPFYRNYYMQEEIYILWQDDVNKAVVRCV